MRPRATIADVAAAAGVSLSTASVALNGRPGVSEATRERIRQVARDLEYSPSLRARSLVTKRAYSIGFVVQSPATVMSADPFFGSFIAGIQVAISAAGYVMVLLVSPSLSQTEDLYRELAQSRRVDGVLIDQLRVNDRRLELVRELGLPAVAIAPSSVTLPLPMAHQSAGGAIVRLVRRLLHLGHRDIAHVAGPPDYVHSIERRDAWESTLRQAGLTPGPLIQGGFTMSAGQLAAEELLALQHLPTAVVCANDLAAIGLIAGLQAAGIDVPGRVSVTGFDGIELGAYTTPKLTTVQATPDQVGRIAASMLLELIDQPDRQPWAVEVPLGPMIPGASVAPPGNGSDL
ncbi:MAG: LacI family transcriptional regulator [Bifidobacteriaceae bacterium]|nr:LacI family transcriptional regulator [Bifidobacteriaceae bacterium]